jgi:hypothetical protein
MKEIEINKMEIKKKIIKEVEEYKEMIKNSKSYIDTLVFGNKNEEEKFKMIEKYKVFKELADQNYEDKNLTNEIIEKRKSISKLFDSFYALDFEEVTTTGEKFKFKYRKVDNDKYDLSTTQILNTEDEVLDKMAPIKYKNYS